MASFNVKCSGVFNIRQVGSPGVNALNAAASNTIKQRQTIKMGTWNGRGLLLTGKLTIVAEEMKEARL